MTAEPKSKVVVLWRCKAEPAIKGIARAIPAGQWQTYREMSMKEAKEFLDDAEKARERIGFEYCVKNET